MKLNLNTHDVYAIVTELQCLIGSQVVNVYDINSQTICIKLRCKIEKLNEESKEDTTNNVNEEDDLDDVENINEKKHILKYLLIESSTKFYLLDDFKAVNEMPSSFSSKLRKHIKNRRIGSFSQLNCDRVIDIQFGTDDTEKQFFSYHLICEFYASGNIILTDHMYSIMTLIHPFTYKNETKENIAKVKVNEIYPFNIATTKVNLVLTDCKKFIEEEFKKIDKKTKLKQFIMKLPLIMFSPFVLEHVLLVCGLQPNFKLDESSKIFDILTDEKIEIMMEEINRLFKLDKFYGYVIENTFMPFLYKQFENDKYIKHDKFYSAVREHFSKVDKFESKEKKIEKQKVEKISKQEKVLVNIDSQISGLEAKTQSNVDQIDNIEYEIDTLQNFLDFVLENVYVTCQLQDVNFENIKLLEYEKHLKTIKFIYKTAEYKWNTELSAYANLGNVFKLNKTLKEKISRAEVAKKTALKQNKVQIKEHTCDENIALKDKKDYWFEQFNWFITSDGFTFVSGKTSDQNETLVKKYLTQNDLYFHSEVFGSGSGILKSNGKNLTEYPKSLEESGNFLVCHTKAWKDNSPDRSYWVNKDQVSKTPESGEYNVKGAFIIRGTKNYITGSKMELGLGILFKVKDKEELQSLCENDIEFAVPVVGHYASLSKYKFKVKIIPGTQKIKKIFPEVLSHFSKLSNQYEKAGIKKIKNDDFQRVLPSGLKFVL